MLHNILNFIHHKLQLPVGSKILLAVSGGIDSMVMLHLFKQCNYELGIAHCNFNLRNEESDGDEQFVIAAAKQAGIKIHSVRFETMEYANANKISTQMAARTLRYTWFEQLMQEHKYDFVAVAHHQTDILETLLINQIRGTGLSGMHGIKVLNGNIIRPLLFVTRDEINEYAITQKIEWREDSSNVHDDYVRNKIRLQILPVLKEINPSIAKTFAANAEHFNNAELLIESFLPQLKNQFLFWVKDKCFIDLEKLKIHQQPKALLFYLLRDFNFKNNLIAEITDALQCESHKLFYSKTHQLLKDRNQIIIEPLAKESTGNDWQMEKEGDLVTDTFKLTMQRIAVNDFDFNFKGDVFTSYFDADKISFPLTIRHWQNGDYFYPIGMNGKKLLSDYFTDAKISQFDKQHILLLLSDENIMWIIGKRADDRFKVTASTQVVLKISYVVGDALHEVENLNKF